jgi:hypothetical protein
VYVGSASGDPITFAQTDAHGLSVGSLGLGNDPAKASYGAIRFEAEPVNRNVGGSGLQGVVNDVTGANFANHSRYYVPGSESLYNITDVVTGNGKHILTDGMHAPGRSVADDHVLGVPMPFHHEVDPEATRTPTGGHYH